MREFFLNENGTLVSMQEWERKISEMKALSEKEGAVRDKNCAVALVKKQLQEAVKNRISDGKYGIMFSGGVDSSAIAFLCKKLGHGNFTCYTASFGSSKDLAAAKAAADMIGLNIRTAVFSLENADKIIRKVAHIMPEPDVVNVGVGSVIYASAMMAKKDNISLLFTGLGSEEIFAGYQRHETAEEINEECWNGLAAMWKRDLLRDFSISECTGAHFFAPFLDEKMIVSAMRIPGKFKINDTGKKAVLREAVLELGVPEQVAFRKKIAAQYGSGFDSAIEKIAKKKGFMHKSEYIKSIN